MGALALLFAVNTAAIIWFVFSYGAGLPVSFLPDVGWRLALLAAGLGALFGILRRRQWARWLAVLGMTALTAALFFIPDTAHYANDAERLATATGGTIVAPALMGWWIYAFGFSSKAKRYFAD
ncbi:hypothetical protein F2P45_08910 [Massilia sp. CCM 8733]|uniref:Uncharacterized protein n=1 Tax=Massilia mucilaginosa TaxID=2609282 RepID=A0ABX0NQH8_9BURK|nr:hypothetical protein [Massilia mucilaginosa]NHZ89136.1 hypothetical protein [Massilia mucilaginosa]